MGFFARADTACDFFARADFRKLTILDEKLKTKEKIFKPIHGKNRNWDRGHQNSQHKNAELANGGQKDQS